MEVNPLRRVLTAKATTLVGLAMLVALVIMVMASLDSVGQAGAKPKPHPKPQFGAKEVISANGALPQQGTYNKRSKGGTLIVSAAGSGFSNTDAKTIGMTAFVPVFAVKKVPKGSVTIALKPLNADTQTDQNDFFRVTVEEQPRR
jgi:hypothetical protein